MSTAPIRTSFHQLAIVMGPGVAVLVAWLLSLPDRDDGAGVTLANVALVMAVVTVGFAVLDWAAGVSTSIAAALSLNYFHTEPYRTLRITDRRDVYSVVLLGALGLAISAVTAARVRRGVTTLRHAEARDAGVALSALLADDRPAREVWAAAIDAAANDLSVVTARVMPRTPDGLPLIGRRMADADDPTLVLPAVGAVLPLQQRHAAGGWLVITPRPGLAPLTVDRRAVLSFADAVELALERSPVPVTS
jgi:K+-sensing histidine kinase KdpD